MRYTIAGLWREKETEVIWQEGRFFGPPDLVARVRAIAQSPDDLCRLSTSLELVGQVLDKVQSVRVDDGRDPSDFDPRLIRFLSAQRRRRAFEAAARSTPDPPTAA